MKMISITANDIVIDGSSAPSPGITVRKKTFSISGAGNITIRHLRFRYADDDCFRIVGDSRNILIENCSFTRGGDGAFDITLDYKNPAHRPSGITVRNCLIAATEKAMLVGGCDELTLERNLFTNNGQRSPQLQDVRNFNLINNHIRNFSIYGVRIRGGSTGNVVGNLIPLSPLKPRRPDLALVIDPKAGRPCKVYTAGNVGPKKRDPNPMGNSRGTIGKLPSGILPVAQVSRSLAATVGARPLDAIDRTLVADKPSLKFRPSRTKDK